MDLTLERWMMAHWHRNSTKTLTPSSKRSRQKSSWVWSEARPRPGPPGPRARGKRWDSLSKTRVESHQIQGPWQMAFVITKTDHHLWDQHHDGHGHKEPGHLGVEADHVVKNGDKTNRHGQKDGQVCQLLGEVVNVDSVHAIKVFSQKYGQLGAKCLPYQRLRGSGKENNNNHKVKKPEWPRRRFASTSWSAWERGRRWCPSRRSCLGQSRESPKAEQ